MTIKIIKEPDVEVTEGELRRYAADYERDHMFYAGPLPTLAEYIRSRKAREKEPNKGWRTT